MLKKFLKSALLCVPFAMSACFDDSPTAASVPVKDSVVEKDSLVYDTVVIDGETIIKVDTIVTRDTIQLKAEEKVPNFVEDTTFSWDNLKDVSSPVLGVDGVFVPTSSSSAKSSSSDNSTPASSSSSVNLILSSSATPSTVEDGILTDGRDGQKYKVETVGDALWMAENIKFITKSGTLCKADDKDYCEKYGVFYSKTAMESACPKGWHLPSEAEVLAADEIVDHEWWTFAGRFKTDGSYDHAEKHGYIWLDDGSTFLAKNYSDSDQEHEIVADTEGRYYNVRCIQNQ